MNFTCLRIYSSVLNVLLLLYSLLKKYYVGLLCWHLLLDSACRENNLCIVCRWLQMFYLALCNLLCCHCFSFLYCNCSWTFFDQLCNFTMYKERHGNIVVSTHAWHAVDLGSIPGPGIRRHVIFGVKTWLSTLYTMYVSWLDNCINSDLFVLYTIGYQPADGLDRNLRVWIWIHHRL